MGMRTSNPLTKTLSTLSLEQSLPRQVLVEFCQGCFSPATSGQSLNGLTLSYVAQAFSSAYLCLLWLSSSREKTSWEASLQCSLECSSSTQIGPLRLKCPKLTEYYQYQNGIYLPMALLGLGGILFLMACRYVVRDKQAVEKETHTL